MDKKKIFKKGEDVKVLSGGLPLHTQITDIQWCDMNKTWKYYFRDEKGSLWFEFEEAIEKIITSTILL